MLHLSPLAYAREAERRERDAARARLYADVAPNSGGEAERVRRAAQRAQRLAREMRERANAEMRA